MRKSQREIKDKSEVLKIIEECQTMRLGLCGQGGYPYVVPLSYGYKWEDGILYIYFHCAKEGKKIDLLVQNNKVCLEVDALNSYASTGSSVTADYKSVIMFGVAEEVFCAAAIEGLELLLSHCKVEGYSAKECVARDICSVYRVTVKSFTGKKRF